MIKWSFFTGREGAAWLLILIMGILLVRQRWVSEPIEPDNDHGLGIDKLIEQVKQDLEAADRKRLSENKEALFRVESFDLEISFVARRTASTETGAKFEVITLGGKTDISAEKVQKMTLHMKAVDHSKGGSMQGSKEFVPLFPPNQKQKKSK